MHLNATPHGECVVKEKTGGAVRKQGAEFRMD